MTAAREVCVDAGLVVKTVLPEPDSELADALFRQWAAEATQLIAPAFFEAEVDSILRQKTVLRKALTSEQAELAFARAESLSIRLLSLPGQRQRAWQIARELALPTVYDATYLALADLRGCEFWTADERLFNAVNDRLIFVKLLGGYVPGGN